MKLNRGVNRNPLTDQFWAERIAVKPQPIRLASERLLAEAEELELDAATRGIKRLYEKYPYPTPATGDSLIRDLTNVIEVLFPKQDFENWQILDAGCGSGHRLLALAQNYRP